MREIYSTLDTFCPTLAFQRTPYMLTFRLSMLNDWYFYFFLPYYYYLTAFILYLLRYQPFDALDSQLKVTVLKSFSVRFSLLTESFRTIRVFPIINGKFQGISLHYGQCINYAEVEKFFIEVPDLKTAVKLVHF